MSSSLFDSRPIMVVLAGPKGSGKSTFYELTLRTSGLRFVNADDLESELGIESSLAAQVADQIRRDLVAARESFVFETVLSDPEGKKLAFLRETQDSGYTLVLCFIGLDTVDTSDQRVAIRVAQGGHDVAKLQARFARTLENLERALTQLPHVLVYDNSQFGQAHRRVAEIHGGQLVFLPDPPPAWFQDLAAARPR